MHFLIFSQASYFHWDGSHLRIVDFLFKHGAPKLQTISSIAVKSNLIFDFVFIDAILHVAKAILFCPDVV